ncbi:Golgi resident protein GCP60 [Dirofilaria immitis]|nr:Golgi resident protein GCP60 [Dirofilaria immitis]
MTCCCCCCYCCCFAAAAAAVDDDVDDNNNSNNDAQEALIKQLQEQHYQQYMAQIYAQQSKIVGASPDSEFTPTKNLNEQDDAWNKVNDEAKQNRSQNSDVSDEEPGEDLPSNPAIAPASMWNRQDIVEFKTTIRKEGCESIIKVGYGETVTVRVPTHEEGNCLFWEFATDHYDIGFGVFLNGQFRKQIVSVHVSESSDEEADEEFYKQN